MFKFNHKVFLTASAILGTTGGYLMAQDAGPPMPDPSFFSFEKFGVAGLMIGGAWFMLRYFMAELAKKDEQLSDLHEKMLEELQQCAASKAALAAALNELKDEIHHVRD